MLKGLIGLNERVIMRARIANRRKMYVLTKSLPAVGRVSTSKEVRQYLRHYNNSVNTVFVCYSQELMLDYYSL